MKSRHSESLILVWRLAEIEARHAGAMNIEPVHLLLGLSKSVDVDLPEVIPKDSPDRDDILEQLLREIRRVRTIFRTAGIDACEFRRALRRAGNAGKVSATPPPPLHRSDASKEVFAAAEQLAELAGGIVFPVHLLHAVLLAEDSARDLLMRQTGFELRRLRTAARQEVMFPTLAAQWNPGRN